MSRQTGSPRAACHLYMDDECVRLDCACGGESFLRAIPIGDAEALDAALAAAARACRGPVTLVLPAASFRARRVADGWAGRTLARVTIARALGVPLRAVAMRAGRRDRAGRVLVVGVARPVLAEAVAFLQGRGIEVASVEPGEGLEVLGAPDPRSAARPDARRRGKAGAAAMVSGKARLAGAAASGRRMGGDARLRLAAAGAAVRTTGAAARATGAAALVRVPLPGSLASLGPRPRAAIAGGVLMVASVALAAALAPRGGEDVVAAPALTVEAAPEQVAEASEPPEVRTAPPQPVVPRARTLPALSLLTSDPPRRRVPPPDVFAAMGDLGATAGGPFVLASRSVPPEIRTAAFAAAAAEAEGATARAAAGETLAAAIDAAGRVTPGAARPGDAPAETRVAELSGGEMQVASLAPMPRPRAAVEAAPVAPVPTLAEPAAAGADGLLRPMPRAGGAPVEVAALATAPGPTNLAAPAAASTAVPSDGRPAPRPVDPAEEIARAVQDALAATGAATSGLAGAASGASDVAGVRPEPRRLAAVPQVPRSAPATVAAQRPAPQPQQVARAVQPPQQARPAPPPQQAVRAQPQPQPQPQPQQVVRAQPQQQQQAARVQPQPQAQPQQVARVQPQAQPAPQQVARAAPAPAAPAAAAPAAAAVNPANMRLIGVFGTSNQRHALVQLPNGSVERVRAGQTVAGVQIAAVGSNTVNVRANGRDSVLRLPD